MPRIATILLLVALLGGTSAAFALTQSLKDEPSPVGVPRFDRLLAPTCDCRNAEARFRFRLREPDRVSAEIVDAGGDVVRTLTEDEERPAGRLVLRWDGRDAAGAVVPDGPYRLRVSLADAGRTILYPTTIRVDTVAPRVELVSVRPDQLEIRQGHVRLGARVLSGGGQGRRVEVPHPPVVFPEHDGVAPVARALDGVAKRRPGIEIEELEQGGGRVRGALAHVIEEALLVPAEDR